MPDFRALAGLAFLRVNARSPSFDPVDNFLPFVAHVLNQLDPSKPVALSDLQAAVETEFGIRIPLHALNTVLQRPIDGKRVVERRNRVFYPVPSALINADISTARAEAARTYESLLGRLSEFAKERFGQDWDRESADQALLTFLDERTVQILGGVLDRTLPAPESEPKGAEYIIAVFVSEAVEQHPSDFDLVLAVIKGAFVAQALVVPYLSEYSRRFKKVTFYFDSPVLFRALGMSGPGLQRASAELLELVHAEHGRLACFSDTFDEMLGVLDAARHQLQTGDVSDSFGEVVHFMVDSGWNAFDVEALRLDLKSRLDGLHVHVEDRPPIVEQHVLDEQALAERLAAHIGTYGYRNPRARDHDVAALAAIHQIRKGKIPTILEESVAVFVTSNSAVARGSAEYFYGDLAPVQTVGATVPLCMLDWMLTTLVWLKAPQSAPDLPRARLIADCAAVVQPPDFVWRRFADEVATLVERGDISGAQYGLLRYSLAARRALSDLTLGGAEDFSAATAREVLRLAEEAIRSDERARREEAERQAKVAAQVAEEKVRDANERAESASARIVRLEAVARRRASRVAQIAGQSGLAALLVIMGLGAYVMFPDERRTVWNPAVSLVLAVAFVGASVFTLRSTAPVVLITRRIERLIEPAALSQIRALMGLDER